MTQPSTSQAQTQKTSHVAQPANTLPAKWQEILRAIVGHEAETLEDLSGRLVACSEAETRCPRATSKNINLLARAGFVDVQPLGRFWGVRILPAGARALLTPDKPAKQPDRTLEVSALEFDCLKNGLHARERNLLTTRGALSTPYTKPEHGDDNRRRERLTAVDVKLATCRKLIARLTLL